MYLRPEKFLEKPTKALARFFFFLFQIMLATKKKQSFKKLGVFWGKKMSLQLSKFEKECTLSSPLRCTTCIDNKDIEDQCFKGTFSLHLPTFSKLSSQKTH